MTEPTELTLADREDIQGVILSGYGHLYYTSYLLLQITSVPQAKSWLRNLLPAITTARPWPTRPDGTTIKPDWTLNLGLTHTGFRTLGLGSRTLITFSREFTEGMAEPQRALFLGDTGESAPDRWELGGPQTPEIHLFLMLHGTSPGHLAERRRQLLEGQDTGVVAIAEESGFRLPSKKEHFGFNDSVSQPIIEGMQKPRDFDQACIRTGEFVLGYTDEYGFTPPTPVVPREADPGNVLPGFPGSELPDLKDFGRNGTYMVYRKLAQDVAGFWRFLAEKSPGLDGVPDPAQMNLTAAKFVGRWASGTPLVLAPERDNPAIADKNDFTYRPDDELGLICPIGAHIRRTNPRDSLLEDSPADSLKTSNRHRIIRRGSLYGEPLFPLDDIEAGQIPIGLEDDGQPRGLHFFSINANIGRQFEFMQQTWANNPRFNRLRDNKDPIIGDNDGTGNMTIPQCPLRRRVTGIPRFVTVRGGGYFFLPSLTALRYLLTESNLYPSRR